ncbi:MAG: hypothetical protein CVU60_08110 [Deltaproteobacteria bacterium HGW-Deltaproteobacteria-18]|nr:MAG: hypothetical protein CVU60_08110 [Deltaproteobacteria bacterium HGW-Deltaproteobacteria-18]
MYYANCGVMMEYLNLGDNWAIDKMERKEESGFLSNYLINKYKNFQNIGIKKTFVLNINADWGFGKTYLLKNWADDLARNGHPVVYFDAWENDFSNEPLVAFISTINQQLSQYFESNSENEDHVKIKNKQLEWFNKGKKLLVSISPILFNVVSKKIAGFTVSQICDLYNESCSEEYKEDDGVSRKDAKEVVSSILSKAALDALESHCSAKETINEFKEKLKSVVDCIEESDNFKIPIFVFVDELDRCRPNYSIELLENIKHLFGVEGVIFVVGTASSQLSESIRKIYGHNFDSPTYLKRFFDQTYTLNAPGRGSYAEYLFFLFGLNNRENLVSLLNKDFYQEEDLNSVIFYVICEYFNVSLRDMYQYCAIIDGISLSSGSKKLHTGLLTIYLIYRSLFNDEYSSFNQNINNKIRDINSSGRILPKIKTMRIKDFYNSVRDEISVGDYISLYLQIIELKHSAIIDQYNNFNSGIDLRQSILGSLISKEFEQFYNYKKLIEHAGRLS